jgi:hypothetical protein
MKNRILLIPWLLSTGACWIAPVLHAAEATPKEDAPPAWPQRWLPVDAGGWSVLKPSADSRLIYVSQDGDDATASAYSPSDKEVGGDPFKPARAVKAYKTLAAGVRKMRAQHPDWLLLRRGDTWKEVLGTLPNGRNGHEPTVVCAYRNVTIRDNVIRNAGLSLAYWPRIQKDVTQQNVRIMDNVVEQAGGLKGHLVQVAGPRAGISFAGNSYYSDAPAGAWFIADGKAQDFDAWVRQSGEQGAKREKRAYPDPGRTIEGYMTHLGKPSSVAAFIEEARKQSKTGWRPEFTAIAVNAWIREGFGVSPWKGEDHR